MNVGPDRIAVTGVGILSSLGVDADSTFAALLAGRIGFGPVRRIESAGFRATIAAEVDLEVADVAPGGATDTWSRSDAMALVAARDALRMAGALADREPFRIAIGASTAGMWEAENVLEVLATRDGSAEAARKLLSFPLSATADRLREVLGPVDHAATVCSACSSGANATLLAVSWLRSGRVRRVLVGGTDALCRLTYAGFNALGATDPSGCRPFDVARDGLTLGEGAAFLVLESEPLAVKRGAEVLAWLTGWAAGAEAFHITQPEPSGATAARLMRTATERAGLDPSQIDYVNAHGTGTRHNDAMESRALEQAFGAELARIWVSSSKGQFGHTLAAAGAMEAAVTVLALARQELPPTGGLEEADPELVPLRHVIGQGRSERVRAALSNSFGFGGTGVVLAFEAAAAPRRDDSADRAGAVITGALAWGASRMRGGHATADFLTAGERCFDLLAGPADDALSSLDPDRSRRFDAAAAVISLSAERLLAAAHLDAAGVAVIAGTAFGAVERSVKFVERVIRRGPRMASPAEFPHLVPSAASGNASIYLGATGPAMSASDLTTSAELAVCVGERLLALGVVDAAVVGGVAPADPLVADVLNPICSGRWGPRSGDGAGWVLLEASETARRRGATVLARLDLIASAAGPRELLEALPDPERDAWVVLSENSDETTCSLEDSAWHRVERHVVDSRAGWHDASGGVALAAAAAAIARGETRQILVWTRRETQWFAALLSAH